MRCGSCWEFLVASFELRVRLDLTGPRQLATGNCFMTWVKICGITNLEDALVAVEAGADAVGFVFYEKSPRYVTVETAREIVSKLPDEIEKVGVFVGMPADAVIQMSNSIKLTAAQIYPGAKGEIPSLDDDFFRKAQCDVILALPTRAFEWSEQEGPGGFFISHAMRDRLLAMLLDSGTEERPGGTGERFDWELARIIAEGIKRMGLKLVVAGGLLPENVTTAVDTFHPWGVDVSSGVETSPGKKDPDKVRAFVRAVRDVDRKVS